jgi:hypothetical protein
VANVVLLIRFIYIYMVQAREQGQPLPDASVENLSVQSAGELLNSAPVEKSTDSRFNR